MRVQGKARFGSPVRVWQSQCHCQSVSLARVLPRPSAWPTQRSRLAWEREKETRRVGALMRQPRFLCRHDLRPLRQSPMSKFHVFEVCFLVDMTRKHQVICAPYSTAKAVARPAMVRRHARALPSSSGLCAMGRSAPASSERQSNGGTG